MCAGGTCQPGPPVSCDDGNPCTDDTCDPATGCHHAPNDAVVCDDGRSCTTDDACHAGVCTGLGTCPCADADGDGFADCSSACDPGGTPCGDCDDHRADVHTGAAETCDHADNDCDASVDEASPKTWTSQALDEPAGGSPGDGYGAAIARLGDVDGDGIDDLAIGAPTTDTPFGVDAGSVVILSGADHSLHCRAVDPAGIAGDRLGTSVAPLPDLTGDGVPDLVAGAPARTDATDDPGHVTILSGADCSVVRSCTDSVIVPVSPNNNRQAYRQLGTTVASAGDQDGDGYPDILAGDPSAFTAIFQATSATLNGRVTVFSGVNCAVLRRLTPGNVVDFARFGSALANLGDLTGDGIDEFAVGMLESSLGVPNPGVVSIYSGASGALLRSMVDSAPEAHRGHLGATIGVLPDLDGDGVVDLAVGEPDGDAAGLVDSGSVVLFSGANGSILRRCTAPDAQAGDRLGAAIAVMPDLDGDGHPEAAVAATNDDFGPLADAGSIVVFSTADCGMLTRLFDAATATGGNLGSALTLAGNLAGDPAGDLAAGTSVSGHAVVFSAASECFEHCAPDDPDNHPGNSETCDGRDNDCDGVADNGDPGGGLDCSTLQPGVCATGTTQCLAGSLVCQSRIAAAPEVCNALDDDCDGSTDEGDPGSGASCGTGQPGICAAGATHCVAGAIVCTPDFAPAPESCNRLDDDCNGAVDDIDPDADGVSNCADNCPLISNPDQSDTDADGVGDGCDICPVVPNADQNPCACDAVPGCFGITGLVVERAAQGGGILRWTTTFETDLLGFYVVTYEKGVRIPLTPSLIPCQQCVTGLGASYAVPIAKHKSAKSLFVEQVSSNGVQRFGPAVKNW